MVVHYFPVEENPEAETHYENLLSATQDIPKHNVLLVVGDCNAHLGRDLAR